MNEIIKVEQLSKAYNGVSAIQNLNISVDRGTVFGLLGTNEECIYRQK